MTDGTRTDHDARTFDELGAHVSTAGGLVHAPGRATEIEAVVLQLFTKQPNRWAEPRFDDGIAAEFRAARKHHAIRACAAHDAYLINLASPDRELFEKSSRSFLGEFDRAIRLGIEFLVTHPGNATDGDVASGLARNADAIATALDSAPGGTKVLLETTAGSGRVLGATFEEIAVLIDRIPASTRRRVGVCFDTCHVWAAGYDLRQDYAAVMQRFDDVIGLQRLELFHLNDSRMPLGSRRDRHAHIGDGRLGDEPFRAILVDDRFMLTPKVLETPKEDDPVSHDRRNLTRLRALRRDATMAGG